MNQISKDIYTAGRSRCPIAWDARKISATGSTPPSRYRPMEAKPAEAMQPHSEHTGFPPNWQGLMVVFKRQ